MYNQFKTQKFKHLMLAMGPRDLNSAPYSPVHCSSHSMTSFQSSELTGLPVVENSQLFAQCAHSACTAHGTPPGEAALHVKGTKVWPNTAVFPNTGDHVAAKHFIAFGKATRALPIVHAVSALECGR